MMNALPKEITIREKYGPAMEITDQAAADEYFDVLVAHSSVFGMEREEAERIERINLGYFAGYYDNETRRRVEGLFKCEHPVFGSFEQNGPPDPKDALILGLQKGAEARNTGGRTR